MREFAYVCPTSLDEAVALLNEPGWRSRALAGGTDVVVAARAGAVDCDRLVDITRIPELKAIDINGRVTVGAAVTFTQLVDDARLQAAAPLLVEACRAIGSPAIRNVGTLGGNVANAAACADSVPALVCLGAEAVVVTPGGETRVPVGELITGPHATRLPAGGLIRAFTFERAPRGSRGAFERIGRRQAMAIARLSVAALGARDADGRVALVRLVPGAVLARFRRATAVEEMLLGQTPTAPLIVEAGRRMAELFLAESGRRWSAEWKEKALAAATERALRRVLGGQDEA
jgi:CO/xanthine dehydrogenase FAD-binding subunit